MQRILDHYIVNPGPDPDLTGPHPNSNVTWQDLLGSVSSAQVAECMAFNTIKVTALAFEQKTQSAFSNPEWMRNTITNHPFNLYFYDIMIVIFRIVNGRSKLAVPPVGRE